MNNTLPPASADTTFAATLRPLLDKSLAYPPEYEANLSSHLPMALHALHSMGAQQHDMQRFFDGYVQRFTAPAPSFVSSAIPWRSLLGQADSYPALLAHFRVMLDKESVATVLHTALPDLLVGVSAAAFHGLIRVAHALEAAHTAELAAALAYWGWRWQALAPTQVVPVQQQLAVTDWVAQLRRASVGWRSDAPLIALRMGHACKTSIYAELAGALRPSPDVASGIAALAAQAIGIYGETANFTVQHMVTGLRALRVLLSWLPAELDPVAIQSTISQAFCAAYMAGNVRLLDAPTQASIAAKSPSWAEVTAKAIQSDDDHTIKLVHTCIQEARHYGASSQAAYLYAAGLAVR